MSDDELKAFFASLQRENAAMREENAAVHAETRRHFDAAVAETRRHFDVVTTETRRHFDVVTEGTRNEIQLVAESVLHLNEKLGRTDERIERTAAETQAMIKFSHAEIDRRMRTLEEAVADLQSRVDRLEDSTH